jgi:glutathione synthase/RimK-type ligase-like ATP-grasp enzyme
VRRCAFLTTDPEVLDGFVTDDVLAHRPLRELGWEVEEVSWRRADVDWDRYEAVVLRSPWDYQRAPGRFFGVLESIERSQARLLNPLALVRWNLDKSYLFDLESRGVPIVPTLHGRDLDSPRLEAMFVRLGVDQVVIKPTIGANADDTFRVRRGDAVAAGAALECYARREFLAQPFLPSVLSEGEYSLFFFGGEHSHSIRKLPKQGDFRVQEEHGGDIARVHAPRELLELGRRAIAALEWPALYARVDLLRVAGDRFGVIELELIEPSLYLRCDPEAPSRFARALDTWMKGEG